MAGKTFINKGYEEQITKPYIKLYYEALIINTV